jgi:hypothetical protein
MALKDILLVASIGATMATGTNTEAKETGMSDNTSSQTQVLSKEEIQEMNFQKNYRHLYKNVSGAWFSFGDEEKIRKALYSLSTFPMGREIIAGIPNDISLGSSNFMSSNQVGSFRVDTNALNLNTSYVDQTTFDNTGVAVSTKDVIFHELLHAYQRKKGITLMDQYPSIDELLHAQKLIEAEAAAWNKALALTSNFSKNKSFYLTPKEVREAIKQDLVAKERNFWKRMRMEDKFDKKRQEVFKKTNPSYCFQQALIACRGNYHLAQKRIVAQEIKKLMNQENSCWTENYNKQALGVTSFLCSDGKVSEHGNPVAYQKMLDYYKKNYNLKPQDIENKQLKNMHADKISLLKSEAKRLHLYSDAQNMTNTHIAQRNNSGRQ